MMSLRVLDADVEAFCEEQYDVCIFASGYESRCTHVPRLLNPCITRKVLVLGFVEEAKSVIRLENDKWFESNWQCAPVLLSGDNEKPIYDHLQGSIRSGNEPIKLLVDYSSMSRLWYSAVLNWARFSVPGRTVIIDFTYSVGKYAKDTKQMVIRDMFALPGCEGRAYRLRESVALFGLGFHGMASLCVLDRLESDTVYTFLASPGASEGDAKKTRDCNNELVESSKTKAVLELPLRSLETCYRTLAETISPHRPDGEITIIPMGPKPHVLASILVSMRFREVSCLRVTAEPDSSDVKAEGDVVATRVIIKENQ